jgi:hypothetical protein
MTNEAEAREVHATETSSEDPREQVNGDQAERPDVPEEDDEMIDPDAVIVEAEVVSVDDEDDEGEDEDEDDEEPYPGSAAAHAVPDAVTPVDSAPDDVAARDSVPADAAPEVSAATGRAPLSAVPADSAPDGAIPVDAAAADSAPADATATGAFPAGSAPAGRHALDETPPDGISPVTAPSGPASSTPTGPVPSAPVPGAASSGLPNNTDVTAPADMAGDPEQLHERWAAIQSTFVDDPHGSVAAAADLVTEAIATLVTSVEEQERGLRGEWDHDGVDTEGLRNALRGYRGLLDRLVTR